MIKKIIFKVKIASILFLFLFFLHYLKAVDVKKNPWELVLNKSNISIYTRNVPTSKFIELRISGILRVSISEFLALMYDVERYREWIPHIIEMKLIERKNLTDIIWYQAVKLPWPLSDRDLVARMSLIVNKNAHTLLFRSIDYKDNPPRSERVRIKIKSEWNITSIHNGNFIRFEAYLYNDPGGWIPSWIVNWATEKMMYTTIQNIEKRIASGKLSRNVIDKFKKFQK